MPCVFEKKNHRSDQYKYNKCCRRCNGNHHQSICPTSKTLTNVRASLNHQQAHMHEKTELSNSSNSFPEHTQAAAVNPSSTINNRR